MTTYSCNQAGVGVRGIGYSTRFTILHLRILTPMRQYVFPSLIQMIIRTLATFREEMDGQEAKRRIFATFLHQE